MVVKFLRKSSVLKDCWVDDEEMGRVPREIQLLARLSHPNIVQVNLVTGERFHVTKLTGLTYIIVAKYYVFKASQQHDAASN